MNIQISMISIIHGDNITFYRLSACSVVTHNFISSAAAYSLRFYDETLFHIKRIYVYKILCFSEIASRFKAYIFRRFHGRAISLSLNGRT